MSEPVFVIHGIGIRGLDRLGKYMAALQKGVGPDWELVPVYWGDLGASVDHLEKLVGQHPERSADWKAWLKDSKDYLGHVTGDYAQTLLNRTRGKRDVARGLHRVSRKQRAPIKERLQGHAHDQFRSMRLRLSNWAVPYAADVLVYQSLAKGQAIRQRVWETMEERLGPDAGTATKPVRILAHSLGGVIAFDMAVSPERPLCVSQLITMGSQPAFFHVMDPRPGLTPYEGEPVALPNTLANWHNLWDEHDLVAFGVRDIFRLANGQPPVDQHIRCHKNRWPAALFMQAHLGYWHKDASHAAIRAALKQVG